MSLIKNEIEMLLIRRNELSQAIMTKIQMKEMHKRSKYIPFGNDELKNVGIESKSF